MYFKLGPSARGQKGFHFAGTELASSGFLGQMLHQGYATVVWSFSRQVNSYTNSGAIILRRRVAASSERLPTELSSPTPPKSCH